MLRHQIGDIGTMSLTTGVVSLAGIFSVWQLFAYTFGGDAGATVDAHGAAEAAHHAGPHIIEIMRWIDVGSFQANWAIRVDALSIVMMAVVPYFFEQVAK